MERSIAAAATVLVAALTTACSSSAAPGRATATTGSTAPPSSSAPAATSSIASSAASPDLPASAPSATAHPATSTPPGTTASTSAGKAVIYGCDQQPVSQPKNFILLCGDGGAWLDQLVWSHWGAVTATATGVLLQKTCVPNCAAGGTTSSPATVTLTGLKDGHYTSLHIVTPKGVSDYRLDVMGPVTTG